MSNFETILRDIERLNDQKSYRQQKRMNNYLYLILLVELIQPIIFFRH